MIKGGLIHLKDLAPVLGYQKAETEEGANAQDVGSRPQPEPADLTAECKYQDPMRVNCGPG